MIGTWIDHRDHGLDTGPEHHWWHDAACRLDPDLWFTEKTEQNGIARHICLQHCPVLFECNSDAEQRKPQVGVQGGVVWVKIRNRTVNAGRHSGHQPLREGCGRHCERWRRV